MRRDKLAPTVRDAGDTFQQETHRVVKALSSKPVVDGVLLEDIDLSASATRVYHRLGRPSRGVILVDATDDTRVWRSGSSTADYVSLVANATRTVSLWVF